ncbi:MAG: Fic family protein, partial [Tissierellia bacterium]|nr:Fic family protein [Tissierellia bacterium]
MSKYEPLFNNTNKITNLVAEIGELVGRISYVEKKNINLRRENRLKTIHSSLAIENNTLSLNQVTAIIDGKRILGNPNEIKEVQNAYEVYEKMISLDPLKIEDLLLAH